MYFFKEVRVSYPGLKLSYSNLELPAKGVFHIYGASGGGKTSLIHGLADLNEYSALEFAKFEDRVRWFDLLKNKAFVFQTQNHFEQMTGRQNILLGRRDIKIDEHQLKEFNLKQIIDRQVGTYSEGEKQRLALLRVLTHRPKILFLDEPWSSLDPGSIHKSRSLIQDYAKNSLIILVSHLSDESEWVNTSININDLL